MRSLPELIDESQNLLAQIKEHPQFRNLRFDCDVTLGDVIQFFNFLQYEAATIPVNTSREGFNQ
ncbi:hypothetical protein [Nostoc sp. FACHB-190]|uniref:hypothetical protein n=1 Tax=Nostoc sp. FACHB-190 TaxID=2692838 RepID=UPI00168625A1|nr:hypothetical protein [Nostoc sp. FACHB-190]MBD2303608.1 hypothetical protein [Nostoc sp. FACHB-190]